MFKFVWADPARVLHLKSGLSSLVPCSLTWPVEQTPSPDFRKAQNQNQRSSLKLGEGNAEKHQQQLSHEVQYSQVELQERQFLSSFSLI